MEIFNLNCESINCIFKVHEHFLEINKYNASYEGISFHRKKDIKTIALIHKEKTESKGSMTKSIFIGLIGIICTIMAFVYFKELLTGVFCILGIGLICWAISSFPKVFFWQENVFIIKDNDNNSLLESKITDDDYEIVKNTIRSLSKAVLLENSDNIKDNNGWN